MFRATFVHHHHFIITIDKYQLTRTNLWFMVVRRDYKFHIEMGDARPVRCKSFRLNEREEEVIGEKVQELYRKGLIEPSSSSWSANPVLVPNRDV